MSFSKRMVALALSGFLDHVESGSWPAGLQGRIRTRYRLLAEARELALSREA